MLITLNPGETRQITYAASQAHTPPVQEYLIANLDTSQTVYIAPADAARQVPDLSTDIARSQLVALQGIHVSANQDWYAYNPAIDVFIDTWEDSFGGGVVTLDVIPDSTYWAPSPAQSAEQIAALGLMTEATGEIIRSGVNTTASNTGTALTTGVPPGVVDIVSYSKVNAPAASSPFTLNTFTANSRLWQVSLSLAAATDSSSYTSGLQRISAQVNLGSGTVLAVAELAISTQSQAVSDHCDFSFNGLPVSAGDTLVLNVNNGGTFTGATIVCSTIVLASTP